MCKYALMFFLSLPLLALQCEKQSESNNCNKALFQLPTDSQEDQNPVGYLIIL